MYKTCERIYMRRAGTHVRNAWKYNKRQCMYKMAVWMYIRWAGLYITGAQK